MPQQEIVVGARVPYQVGSRVIACMTCGKGACIGPTYLEDVLAGGKLVTCERCALKGEFGMHAVTEGIISDKVLESTSKILGRPITREELRTKMFEEMVKARREKE